MTMPFYLMMCDFKHGNEEVATSWHDHKVASRNNYKNVSYAYKRTWKLTGIHWGKCTCSRKQTVEDAHLKGCVPNEYTQQMGNVKSSSFNSRCTKTNQNMSHACAIFNVQKEAYFVLR